MKLPLLRSPLPLRHAIPLMVFLFGLAWTTIATSLHLRSEYKQATTRVENGAASVASQLASDPEWSKDEMVWLKKSVGLTWAVVVDGNHQVIASTEDNWKGLKLEKVASPGALELARQASLSHAPVQNTHDNQRVWACHPVPVRPGVTVPWLALVEHDLSVPLAIERRAVTDHALITAGIQVIGCILLWWLLRRFLQNRMLHLFDSAGTDLLQAVGAKPILNSQTDEFTEIFRVLKESGNRLDQIADNIQDVFFLTDPDKKVIYISPAYTRIFGREGSEMIANSNDAWKQSVLEEYHEMLWHVSDPLREGAPEVQCEFRVRRPDGKIRWIELRMFPVRDERGGLIYMAGLSRDVTDRKELEQEILNISERERRRIGHDIHDDLCQRLAAIKFKCEFVANKLKNEASPLAAQAQEVCTLMSDSTKLCRGIARGLSPVDLVGEGFVLGIDKLVKATESLYDIPCFFYCPNSVLVDSPSAAVHLYRITQEFLNNAVRHGNPTRIDIRLEMNTEFVRIEVVNDGIPFKEPGPTSQGMGLRIQRHRAAAIGATVRTQARSDGIEGTVATCVVPHSSCNPDTPSSA